MNNRNYYGNYRQDNRPESNIKKIINIIKNTKQTLFKDFISEDLYLPEGKAYQIANELTKTKTNQIRKVFSMIKEAEYKAKNKDFESGRDTLYMIVPLMAYSVSRELVDKDLFELIKVCITSEKIKS